MTAHWYGRVVGVTNRDELLDGGLNVRDLGGLLTNDGRQVRPRRLLRAASLAELTAAAANDPAELLPALPHRVAGEAQVERDGRGLLATTAVTPTHLERHQGPVGAPYQAPIPRVAF